MTTDIPKPQCITTGHAALDEELRGGWPRGYLTELVAASNVTSTLGAKQLVRARRLAVDAIVACQRAGGVAALIDTDGSADVAELEAAGVDLAALLLSQPDVPPTTWEISERLVRSGAVDLVVLWGDTWGDRDSVSKGVRALHIAAWQGQTMPNGGTAVLILTSQATQPVKYYASLRVCARAVPTEWAREDRAIPIDASFTIAKATRYLQIGAAFGRVDLYLGLVPRLPFGAYGLPPFVPQTERELGEQDGDDDARDFG